jgi:hypothetical protein
MPTVRGQKLAAPRFEAHNEPVDYVLRHIIPRFLYGRPKRTHGRRFAWHSSHPPISFITMDKGTILYHERLSALGLSPSHCLGQRAF